MPSPGKSGLKSSKSPNANKVQAMAVFSDADLPRVLERKQGYLVAQPIFQLPGTKSVMHEILLRLTDDTGTEILPRQFLPAAVKLNLMPQIDCLTLHLMEHQMKVHHARLQSRLAVNISRRSLLYQPYQEILFSSRWQPLLRFLVIEVKAADIVRDNDALKILTHLGKLGAGIAINFAEGGAAMVRLLHRLGFTILKVDLAELHDFKPHQMSQFIEARKVAADLGLSIVFERVESSRDEQFLKPFLPALVQGYFYGKPTRGLGSITLED